MKRSTVYAEQFHPNITSSGAGGIWGPYKTVPEQDDLVWRWANRSYEIYERMARQPGEHGVSMLRGTLLYASEDELNVEIASWRGPVKDRMRMLTRGLRCLRVAEKKRCRRNSSRVQRWVHVRDAAHCDHKVLGVFAPTMRSCRHPLCAVQTHTTERNWWRCCFELQRTWCTRIGECSVPLLTLQCNDSSVYPIAGQIICYRSSPELQRAVPSFIDSIGYSQRADDLFYVIPRSDIIG